MASFLQELSDWAMKDKPAYLKSTKPVEEQIKEAKAKGDTKRVQELEYGKRLGKDVGAGLVSAGVGMVTGLPDLGILGYNMVTGDNVKDIRTRILEQAGVPTKASSADNDILYNAPEYLVMAYGLKNLVDAGWKGFKGWKESRKVKEFLGDLPADEANRFKKFMMSGQGSDDPMIAATLQRLKNNPKYKETFNVLERAATDAAMKGISPRPSKMSEPTAAEKMAGVVESKLDAVIKARSEAGNKNFTKAMEAGGQRPILDTDSTLATVRKLKAEYEGQTSDSAKSAVKWLQSIEDRLVPTGSVSGTAPTTTVVRAGEAARTIPGMQPRTIAGTPDRTIPGSAGYTTTSTEMVRDASGMLRPSSGRSITVPSTQGVTIPGTPSKTVAGTPNTVIPGTADVKGTIPGAAGYDFKYPAKQLTVEETQSLLKEWGRSASKEGTAVRDLAVGDEERIAAALFGSLKDDLVRTVKTTPSPSDRKALGYLMGAREQTKQMSEAYTKLVSQGMPEFMKGKTVAEISFEKLEEAYKGLNPSQRQLFRSWVGENNKEALQAIDSSVFKGWANKFVSELGDGMPGYDLGAMAKAWMTMPTKEKDALAAALGTNATEFTGRMRDALVFTRKMETGSEAAEASTLLGRVKNDAAAVVGASPAGYQGAKAAQLALDAVDTMLKKKGLTDEQLMKVLLTKEGADFLKNAKLSPMGRKTVEALTKLENTSVTLPLYATMTSGNRLVNQPDQMELPDDLESIALPSGLEDIQLPADLEDIKLPDDLELPTELIGEQQYPTEASMRSAVQGTANEPPATLDQIQADNPNVQLKELQRRLSLGVR